jgi:hypothetical protein
LENILVSTDDIHAAYSAVSLKQNPKNNPSATTEQIK